MNAEVEPIDGGKATLAELRRAGIDALAKALGPVGMARFLQQFDSGQGVATIWVSGYCLITVKASSGVPVSHASRSSFARIAGIRCLTL